jgi:hypothetical protein
VQGQILKKSPRKSERNAIDQFLQKMFVQGTPTNRRGQEHQLLVELGSFGCEYEVFLRAD